MKNQISITGLPDENTIAKRYTQALFSLAEEQGLAEEFLCQLNEITAVLAMENSCLSGLLSTGKLSLHKQKELLQEVFATSIHPLLQNMLLLMLDKGRGGYFCALLPAYQRLMDEKAGVLPVTAYCPKPLDDLQEVTLTASVAKLCGKQIRLQQEIDATLIGGLKLIIEGTVYDGTIKRKLEKLEERLKYN
ncbi:MAG: ATP synthase F1 subunit delta [Clostridiales bacterium]|nr:ATP synthase F1 subunit delta [Clostridiales bacterium]